VHHVHLTTFGRFDPSLHHTVNLLYPWTVPAEVVENIPAMFIVAAGFGGSRTLIPPALVLGLEVGREDLLKAIGNGKGGRGVEQEEDAGQEADHGGDGEGDKDDAGEEPLESPLAKDHRSTSCTMAIIITAPAKCTQGVITAEWLKLRCSCYPGKQQYPGSENN
jgi:hypothetical protein